MRNQVSPRARDTCLGPDPRGGGQLELPDAPSALETSLFLQARGRALDAGREAYFWRHDSEAGARMTPARPARGRKGDRKRLT